jgi:hypothetical protein
MSGGLCFAWLIYSERQLALVRARMPMKLGVKTARAKTVAMRAVYMVFLLWRAEGLPAAQLIVR